MAVSGSQERKIGDILVEQGRDESPAAGRGAAAPAPDGATCWAACSCTMGYCEEQDIIEALGVQSGMERVDLTKLKIHEDVVRKVHRRRRQVLQHHPHSFPRKRHPHRRHGRPAQYPGAGRPWSDPRQCEVRGAVSNHADDVAQVWKNELLLRDRLRSTRCCKTSRIGSAPKN